MTRPSEVLKKQEVARAADAPSAASAAVTASAVAPPAGAPAALPHPWSKEALLAKAQRYASSMQEEAPTEWKFVLWSTLMLELLGRAALANIHPALLGETKTVKDWHNLYFALGFDPIAPKFIPHSISVSEVFDRLHGILTDFNADLKGFAVLHMGKRNEEVHSGKSPFDGGDTRWQARFYETCDVLLQSMGESLELLFGEDQAKAAREQIAAANDESAKSVAKAVDAHRKGWEVKSEPDRTLAVTQATVWAARQEGHRVTCPACKSPALVKGKAAAPAKTQFEDDHIVEKQLHLPSSFECIACGLKISGLAQIAASGLGDTYVATNVYTLEEFYENFAGGPDFDADMNEF